MRGREEAGFGLIEVIVTAAVLVVVVLGVFKGLDAAASTSGREKARSVAGSLAQQDQERMRGMRGIDLSGYEETRTIKVSGVDYRVESRATWVRDDTGGTPSCTNASRQADYLRLASKVTSAVVGTDTQPVSLQSIMAAPVKSFGATQGTLAVQVNDRDGKGVPGLPVAISRTTGASATTNGQGCALFQYIPVGPYDVTLDQAGWVNPAGRKLAVKSGQVTSGTVNLVQMEYDRAGKVKVSFDRQDLDGKVRPDAGDAVTVTHAGIPDTDPVRPGSLSFAAPALAPAIEATSLFPFPSRYGVYSGRCREEDPTQYDANYFTKYAGSTVKVEREGVHAVTVREPALNIVLKREVPRSGDDDDDDDDDDGPTVIPTVRIPDATRPTANVVIKLRAAAPCAAPVRRYTGRISGASDVHPNSAAVTAALRGRLKEPGLPFGSYEVCVDDYDAVKNARYPRVRRMVVNNTSATGTLSVDATIRNSDAVGRCS